MRVIPNLIYVVNMSNQCIAVRGIEILEVFDAAACGKRA